jgi:nucleotide-binding universal stress UspA family protein
MIRNILLQLDRDDRNAERTALAVALAQRHEAHLTGLFAHLGLPAVYPWGEGLFAREVLQRHEETTDEAAGKLRAEFEQRAGAARVSHEWRMEEEEGMQSILATYARYADVAVVSQTARSALEDGPGSRLAEEVVLASGAPTIIVPDVGKFDKAIDRAVIAWNGSRESSRAVRDALPILQAVEKVVLFGVHSDQDDLPGSEIARYLARHGIKVDDWHTIADDTDVGDAILNAVADYTADLLVMGAYGHARLREFVFGGATRHVLRHMTSPTLLVH